MKISNTKKVLTTSKLPEKEPETKEVSDVKDNRDLENSLTDWNAEHNQSGRHK
ncbi:hypothetical protein [Flavobacterium tegetincola]|uniref:hypothetical protein n=1 Tax=Flavobacterium tegetincola TaxID=150172 RepID=UPI0003FF916F|nr:hypothetical protein [Flavobacterium tegetincola]